MSASGDDDASMEEVFARMPRDNFLRSRPDQIAWQVRVMRAAPRDRPVVGVRYPTGRDGLEIFVHMRDRDGLFAALVIALDRMGLGVQQARVLDGPDDTIFDTFHVQPMDTRIAPVSTQVETQLAKALSGDLSCLQPARRSQPRHLRHFRIAPQLDFAEIAGGTRIGLVCNDRPGLLADVTRVLREHRLRVHDARIATFGERAEDMFQISDEHDRPLHDDHQRQALRDALLAALDGDPR